MAGLGGWWEGAFKNGVYPLIEMTRSPLLRGATRREAQFLRRALGLGRGSRVLDLACGAGRHSLELARRGCEVTGLDLSPRYLAEARRRAGRGGVRVLGGFDGSPYDPRRSRRLLVIARRPSGDHASSG